MDSRNKTSRTQGWIQRGVGGARELDVGGVGLWWTGCWDWGVGGWIGHQGEGWDGGGEGWAGVGDGFDGGGGEKETKESKIAAKWSLLERQDR